MYNYEESIFNAIDTIINRRLKDLKFNYYIQGKVLAINPNGTVNIDYHNQTIPNVKVKAGVNLSVNNIVYVCVPNNELSFLFVDCVMP